jgi:predicted transposase YdaD
VLVHIEVQSQQDAAFAERMFRYHARLYDHYRRNVVSLAILGDGRPRWRPDRFEYALWGCSLQLRFPTAKLRDYDLADLEASDNPCATVVLAHLTAQATRDDPTTRARAKINLTRRLYQRGYDRAAIERLYRFIDWLLRLPEELETATWLEIKAMQEEQAMTYITTAERYGREAGRAEGRVEGRVEGLVEAVATALQARFAATGLTLLPEIRQIDDPAMLQAILTRTITATTVDEVRAVYAEDVQTRSE